MGRHARASRRKLKVRREECTSLSIVDVCRAGLVWPGESSAGMVESLSGRGERIVAFVPMRGVFGQTSGTLTLFEGRTAFDVAVQGRPVPTRHRLHWFFLCPLCDRRVRLLLRPEAARAGWGWVCSRCLGVGYSTGRDGARQRCREHRAQLMQLRAEIDFMLSLPDRAP